MPAEYTTRATDEEVVVSPKHQSVWVSIDGLRIHIMRDGSDDKPEVYVDVWRDCDLGKQGGPIQTIAAPSLRDDYANKQPPTVETSGENASFRLIQETA